MQLRRAVILVIDSFGAGEAPDAAEFGDAGADTIGHVAEAVGGLELPNFQAAGLGNLHGAVLGVPPAQAPGMAFGRLAKASAGKDSMTGHWEIAGLITLEPFATFEDGFPPSLIDELERAGGHKLLGNYPASGTVIIEELGREHFETGRPIIYTSADSVLQLAAHESVMPLEELYRLCRVAREIADGHHIGRVIARPFKGELGAFSRGYERRDYAMAPPQPTLLDNAQQAGLTVVGVGKIEDLFSGRGLTSAIHTEGDADGMEQTIAALDGLDRGLVFTNLVDLDTRYGHRENPVGYAEGLRLIDRYLPRLVAALGDNDLLIVTADHGNDPTDADTDHTRELVPLLAHGPRAAGVDLGIREQYSDAAATVAEGFDLPRPERGRSFFAEIT
ncbi:MAG: phosphopentomutase [Acidimicrobiia bacterium]